MTERELSNKLKEMYENAPDGEQVAYLHLFGIIFVKEIKSEKHLINTIVKNAGIPESYRTEINKGAKLSKYVKLKDNINI